MMIGRVVMILLFLSVIALTLWTIFHGELGRRNRQP
jgi:hypothetical protein